MRMNSDLPELASQWGIHLVGVRDFQTPGMARDYRLAMDAAGMAMDAPGALQTLPNSGIPAWFTTFMDPNVIRVVMSPLRATEILGNERRMGDWTTNYAQFPMVEQTGEVAAYGDWNNNGIAGANYNWVPRQAFHYQVITRWGEQEVARAGAAGLNYKNDLDMASVQTLNRFQNATYFYGVSGLLNYGILNDPSLPTPISPTTKAGGGTAWTNATANEIADDALKLVTEAVDNSDGLLTIQSRFTLALSPGREALLARTNSFGLTARAIIEQAFTGMRIVSAPEYSTIGGELMQLWAADLDGQEVAYTSFTEKLRAHAVVVELSAWLQKKSQGTFGAIIKQPLGSAQMLGI